ncbi:LOW QUALITY PROTEIN: chaperonin-containing T-complex member BBS12 [Menidia menidia]
MLVSAVVNSQQHAGLQKLCALAGMSHSSLGPDKRFKFIQDEASGESTLACSCFRVIESLQPSCAVGTLVLEALQAQQKLHRGGAGCLLFLAGAWSRAALESLQNGVPVPQIVSAMSEGMDACVEVCMKAKVSILNLPDARTERRSKASGVDIQALKNKISEVSDKERTGSLSISAKRKVRLSRHFCEAVPEVSQPHSPEHSPEHPDITRIAEALSHGCHNAMKLALDAVKIQSEDGRFPVCDTNKMATCVFPGLPEEQSCVVKGFVVLLSDEQAAVALDLKEKQVKAAFITGDLSYTYRHVGFKQPAGVQTVRGGLDPGGRSQEEEWLDKVEELLLRLDVTLVLASGRICDKLVPRCCRSNVVIVGGVKPSILRALAAQTGAVMVAYASQLSGGRGLGVGLRVGVWRELGGGGEGASNAVRIWAGGEGGGLVTAAICSHVGGHFEALEDRFWACARRLQDALMDGVLLPGAGQTERLCIQRLRGGGGPNNPINNPINNPKNNPINNRINNPLRGLVLQLMADGFVDYISTVMVNRGGGSRLKARAAVYKQMEEFKDFKGLEGGAEVYDNLRLKLEAWRRALDLVLLVLLTDAEVITGTQKQQENLLLL